MLSFRTFAEFREMHKQMASERAIRNKYKLTTGPVVRDEAGNVRKITYVVEMRVPKKKPACSCQRAEFQSAVIENFFKQTIAKLPHEKGFAQLSFAQY